MSYPMRRFSVILYYDKGIWGTRCTVENTFCAIATGSVTLATSIAQETPVLSRWSENKPQKNTVGVLFEKVMQRLHNCVDNSSPWSPFKISHPVYKDSPSHTSLWVKLLLAS